MPTRDTKSGLKHSLEAKVKGFVKSLGEYREARRDDLFKYTMLFLIALISAVIIQDSTLVVEDRTGLDYFVGSFLIIIFVLFIFFKDIRRYKPAYLNDNKMMLLLGLLITGTLLMGRVFAYLLSGLQRGLDLPVGEFFIFGIPIPVGAMLITLLFDFHLAISFSFVMALLTGIWFNSPYFPVYCFIGNLTGAFCVLRCKRRSALIRGGIIVAVANCATAGVILLLKGDILSSVAPPSFLFAAVSGISVTAIVTILLPVIEYLFNVRTDISLVELLDHDQPLLRALMVNAPGTYHHSVIVGNLAETAAEVVGANPLLARVGAMYHDVGKLKMPEYFIENQTGAVSKHERLTPTMSSMILINHIKEGIELARQYKLPQPVVDIIQQHHGDSLISYFYQKAKEQKHDGPIVEGSFRYPGPRPQTRVAALTMMADAVEAASRTLNDPTPARIEAHVEKIINNVYLAGQIDECELTLKDISEIKRRFTYILTSIFHKRIVYPEQTVKAMQQKEERLVITQSDGSSSKEQTKCDKDKSPEDRGPGQEGSHRAGQ